MSTVKNNNNPKRLEELDGLRGLAALAVVFFHFFYHYNEVYKHDFPVLPLLRIGHYGVHLFFLVSGFVIFWSISRSQKPIDFVWSRFTRLYPVFWVAVTITFIIVSIFTLPYKEVSFVDYIFNLTMLHEYMQIKHVDGSYWTLTLELAFYFWMFFLFSINQIKNIEKWLIAWILIAIISNLPMLQQSINPLIKKFFLLEYIQFFTAGICFYKIWQKQHNNKIYLLLLLCLTTNIIEYSFKGIVVLTIIHALFYLAVTNKLKILSLRIFTQLGAISYSLYLIHQNIGYVIIREFYKYNLSPFTGIIIAFIISISLAYLLTYFIEKPSLKYLRRTKK